MGSAKSAVFPNPEFGELDSGGRSKGSRRGVGRQNIAMLTDQLNASKQRIQPMYDISAEELDSAVAASLPTESSGLRSSYALS